MSAGTMTSADELLTAAAAVVGSPSAGHRPPYAVGVDLGTASTVLTVTDTAGVPVLVEAHPSGALRDGVVVDFIGASRVVAMLRDRARDRLGVELTATVTASPPGVPVSDQRTCAFVCERAGFTDVALTDEVTAANALLDIADGVVVDVGGGSTGVGIIEGGRLVRTDDRPGGGHHLDLMLAGALGIGRTEAEQRKRDAPDRRYLDILRPGIERIATAIAQMVPAGSAGPVHLAGGALRIDGAAEIVADVLGRDVRTHPHAELITPLGIASRHP
jgi:ethanolamine utilization protein EutJ